MLSSPQSPREGKGQEMRRNWEMLAWLSKQMGGGEDVAVLQHPKDSVRRSFDVQV